jgi:hypothetical protein
MFWGAPPTSFKDPEFGSVRHVNVPRFSEEELEEVWRQAPGLRELRDSAGEELREILRVPFNLRLLGELLSEGVHVSELTPISTQLELLQEYWGHRVTGDDRQGDAREFVLRNACERMLEARRLRVERRRLITSAPDGPILDDVLSRNVLLEVQPSSRSRPDSGVLEFSHHILFDFAVARLVLGGEPETLIKRISDDPDLTLVARPSFLFTFQRLWVTDRDRRRFWDLVFRLVRAEGVPEIAKVIGPSVAAEVGRELSDLGALTSSLGAGDASRRSAAETVLAHLVISLVVASAPDREPVGERAGPWCDLAELLSRDLRDRVAFPLSNLLVALCERLEKMSRAQLVAAGQAARRLLEYAWSRPQRERHLVVGCLRNVCRTFSSDPEASAGLLRKAIEPEHLAKHGSEELVFLERELKPLMAVDPVLVRDVYCAAFSYREASEEKTPLGTSQIMRLVSNRKQDYEMVLSAWRRISATSLPQPRFRRFKP